jgi:hypothetical protein
MKSQSTKLVLNRLKAIICNIESQVTENNCCCSSAALTEMTVKEQLKMDLTCDLWNKMLSK